MATRSHRQLENLLQLQALAIENSVHEMRGLLIAGNYAKLLARVSGPLTPVQMRYVDSIVQSTAQLKELFGFLGCVARCQDITVTRVALPALLEDSLNSTALPYTLDPPVEAGLFVLADKQKFHAVIRDLLAIACWTDGVQAQVGAENARAVIILRNIRGLEPRPMATEMLRQSSMSACASSNRASIRRSEETIRLHGGSLTIRYATHGDIDRITIRLPALRSSHGGAVRSGAFHA